jgi:DNA-binding beta-propeller fold protein YncE
MPSRRTRPLVLVAALALAAAVMPACRNGGTKTSTLPHVGPAPTTSAPSTTTTTVDLAAPGIRHLEYVLVDGSMSAYDIDAGHRLVDTVAMPTASGVRGVAADPAANALYITYGGDGGPRGNGSMLRWDLVAKKVVWDRHYDHGIDSLAVSADGSTLYVPDGELAGTGLWYVVAASTGAETATIQGGAGAHNTVVRGNHVYLGGRDHNELEVFDAAAGKIAARIGPLKSGVRPFTVNGRETLAFTTATGFLGFQVIDLTNRKVLSTETFAGFTWNPKTFPATAPSHGISLSPDEREVYVVDGPNSVIHVFDVSGLPATGPKPLADIRLAHPFAGNESPCAYDCARDGWVQHSRDGRFVYVGDSGDVIDTATKQIVAFLPALANTRKHLEIDWRGDTAVASTSRHGLGYVMG